MSKTRLILDNRINLQAAINKNYSLKEFVILLKNLEQPSIEKSLTIVTTNNVDILVLIAQRVALF